MQPGSSVRAGDQARRQPDQADGIKEKGINNLDASVRGSRISGSR